MYVKWRFCMRPLKRMTTKEIDFLSVRTPCQVVLYCGHRWSACWVKKWATQTLKNNHQRMVVWLEPRVKNVYAKPYKHSRVSVCVSMCVWMNVCVHVCVYVVCLNRWKSKESQSAGYGWLRLFNNHSTQGYSRPPYRFSLFTCLFSFFGKLFLRAQKLYSYYSQIYRLIQFCANIRVYNNSLERVVVKWRCVSASERERKNWATRELFESSCWAQKTKISMKTFT